MAGAGNFFPRAPADRGHDQAMGLGASTPLAFPIKELEMFATREGYVAVPLENPNYF